MPGRASAARVPRPERARRGARPSVLGALALAACVHGAGAPRSSIGADATPAADAPSAPGAPVARPWPEADALFHADPRWLGGDVASSVDLGGGRVLWLFGDSFVAPGAERSRRAATMVRSTVAIETGTDPSRASMAFRWGTGAAGAPAAFFASEGGAGTWTWPAHGAMVDGALVVFLMRVAAASGGLGFRADGWTAVRVDEPAIDPSRWTPLPLATPARSFGVTFGASLLVRDGYLYAFGAEDETHAVYLARWPAGAVARGDLRAPAWWTPSGWIAQDALAALPAPLFRSGATELSVQTDPRGAGWLEVQTTGFGAATLDVRSAPELTGPWSPLATVDTPPESGRPGVLVYEGKGHPELQGAQLVATYASNAGDFATLVADASLYYPRFVRVDWAPRDTARP